MKTSSGQHVIPIWSRMFILDIALISLLLAVTHMVPRSPCCRDTCAPYAHSFVFWQASMVCLKTRWNTDDAGSMVGCTNLGKSSIPWESPGSTAIRGSRLGFQLFEAFGLWALEAWMCRGGSVSCRPYLSFSF